MFETVEDRFEENPLSSRIESLHRLLEVGNQNEEEYSVVWTLGKR